ncbi:hypothetical protein [Nocardioides sp. B-3]|uniref:hypothetical protein n=1 Tax=Nocardioides sp. B-3 TaxID=2895565 RepID=UPI0021530D2C|nr:hypothetical protein [Nocardioides sp. B-3]UUZ61195.1 hypothetical protein LP418_11600 [Nocardioides sp. B-3]
MIPYPIPVALAAVGLSCAVNGGALLLAGRARLSAALLVLGGTALVVATVVSRNDHPDLAATLFAVAAGLACPLAVAAYPALNLRRLVDFPAPVALLGAGVFLVAAPRDPVIVSAMAMAIGRGRPRAHPVAHRAGRRRHAGTAALDGARDGGGGARVRGRGVLRGGWDRRGE